MKRLFDSWTRTAINSERRCLYQTSSVTWGRSYCSTVMTSTTYNQHPIRCICLPKCPVSYHVPLRRRYRVTTGFAFSTLVKDERTEILVLAPFSFPRTAPDGTFYIARTGGVENVNAGRRSTSVQDAASLCACLYRPCLDASVGTSGIQYTA